MLNLSASHSVSVTWNSTSVSGPVLIYHDEVLSIASSASYNSSTSDGPGGHVLVCSGDAGVAWYHTNGDLVTSVPVSPVTFYQRRAERPAVARLLRDTDSPALRLDNRNGLWVCQRNDTNDTAISVGLYQRGGGEVS